jgi:hypothetical protein
MERIDFARRLARNTLLWILPMALVWLLLTPSYNRFLAAAGEILLHLGESPNASRLHVRDTHVLRIVRTDIGGGQNALHETRLSDFHFDWILLGVLFLATPAIAPRRRAETMAWSVAALLLFHLLLVVFYVESVYANDLGDWSLRHYGAWARNFWGLGEHLLDLPFKFALPFALWALFHLGSLDTPPAVEASARKRKTSAKPSA